MNFKGIQIAVLSLTVAFGAIAPASAAPFTPTSDATLEASPVLNVQSRRHFDGRRDWKRQHRDGYYNGHRGYREKRRGYRRHSDGWWYPLAAFGAGAILGGAITNGHPSSRSLGQRHYQWCASRYKTYRASDNTYVPSAGRRAVCNSPYS